MSDDAITKFHALQEERRRQREEIAAPSLIPPEAWNDAPMIGTPEFDIYAAGIAAIYATAPQLTSAPYSPATVTPWANAPAPAPAPVAHVTAPASAPIQADERDRQIANDPRVKGREALAAELAAALPSASADAIAAKVTALGTKVVAPSLRHGRSPVASSPAAPGKRNGLRLAVEAMVRRDAGLAMIPRESSALKNGHQLTPRGGGGLRAAVTAMVEEDARRGR